MQPYDDEFTRFVTASAPTLTRLAWFLTGNTETAADILQDTYTKTYIAWGRIRPQEALAYARTTLTHTNIDRHRRQHGESHLPPGFDIPTTTDTAETIAQRDHIARLLAPLPTRQRQVITLRYALDLSEQTTADTLGITVGAVKQAASRALQTLRAHAVAPADKEYTR